MSGNWMSGWSSIRVRNTSGLVVPMRVGIVVADEGPDIAVELGFEDAEARLDQDTALALIRSLMLQRGVHAGLVGKRSR